MLMLPWVASWAQPAPKGAAPASAPDWSSKLSPTATAWLQLHHSLSVGVVPEWPPIDGLDASGAQVGVSADVLKRLAQVLGLRLKVVRFDNFSQAVSAAAAGQVDVLSSMARTPEREKVLKFTRSYLVLPVVYIGRRGLTDFTETADFGGLRIAVERGYPVHEWLQHEHPHAHMLVVDSTLEALRAVADGRADLYRGALTPAHYLIERELLSNLEVVATDHNTTTALTLASASPEVRDVLDAALDWIGTADLLAVAGRWQPEYLALTPELRPVLPQPGAVAALGEVRVVFDASFAPLSGQARDGAATGLGPAMFKRAADAVGLHYRLIAKPSFEEAAAAIRQGEAEVLVAAVRTPERERYAIFVGPYYSEPSAIVSRLGDGWPSLSALAGRRLAIDAGHYLIPFIQRKYPSVQLVVVRTAAGVLNAVGSGQADAGISNVEVAAHHVEREYAGRLQVSGLIESEPSELSFMVRADRPELARALRVGFDAIPQNDRRTLANTLLRTTVQVGVSWQDLSLVAVPTATAVLGVLLAGLVYTRRLQRARAQLQAERDRAFATAQARKEFVAELGHEVRTPLSALVSGLRLLSREQLPDDARSLLASLETSSGRTLALLNSLLDVARMEEGHFELHLKPTELGALLRESVAPFGALAMERGTRIVIAPMPHLPLLLLDPQRTQQVINNLLSNAVKFTESGTVTVRLVAEKASEGLWDLQLDVQDTGAGMTAEQLQSIFERFAQAPGTQERYGGSGLGLTISAQIVQSAGGQIDVRSEPGQGTTFTVRIQAREAEPAADPAQEARRLSALLVDDDPVCRIVSAEQLKSCGLSVHAVPDRESALRELAQDAYDLLITDVSMRGDADGLQLSREAMGLDLHRLRWVVVLSGQESPSPLPSSVGLWLSKPSHPGDKTWLRELTEHVGLAGRV